MTGKVTLPVSPGVPAPCPSFPGCSVCDFCCRVPRSTGLCFRGYFLCHSCPFLITILISVIRLVLRCLPSQLEHGQYDQSHHASRNYGNETSRNRMTDWVVRHLSRPVTRCSHSTGPFVTFGPGFSGPFGEIIGSSILSTVFG